MSEIVLDDTQDRYTPDAGIVTGPVCCGVCGDEMECLARGSTGPRGFVEAMSMNRNPNRKGSPHDIFSCHNREAPWHRQVIALRNAARKTPSGRLAAMFREEASDILKNRMETKTVSPFDV